MWAKTSRQSRGYGAEWSRLRKVVMLRDMGLCHCDQCKAEKRVTLAHEVDHIKPKAQGGTDDLSNLRAVSRECHKRITAEQRGKKLKLIVKTGLDGWPIG